MSSFRALFDGVEIPKIIKIPDSKKSHWKAVIEHTIADVCTHNADKTILFLWDEIPYMLDNIKNQYPDANFSLEILDTLRALRQEHHNLRMIYTGSIGVHHVLTKVKIDSPIQSINDLHTARLLPIDTEDAIDMAHYRFVTKEKIAPSVERELLHKICQFCDNVPYYIKEVIAKLSIANEMPTIENIDNMLNNLLLNYSNDLNLEHFRARLKDYYTGEILDVNGRPIPRYRLAKLLLNHIAISETATIESCFSQLTHYYSLSFEHRDDLIELLTLLSKDHYLIKTDNGYQFAFSLIKHWWIFSLIKRWWIEAEGLEEAVQ